MYRRSFLQKLSVCIFTGLISLFNTRSAFAAWPAKYFASGDLAIKFDELFATFPISDSPDIKIDLPDIAENGAVVPISISSDLLNIQRIYIWVEKNPTPLVAEFEFSDSMAIYLTARIKMAESCPVMVIAQQGNRFLRAQKWVKVMQGGCGTG
jgi:sulfur-oxidizing protein SoxY